MYPCPECRRKRSEDGLMCEVCYERTRQENASILNAPPTPLAHNAWNDVLRSLSENQPAFSRRRKSSAKKAPGERDVS